jgi:hypothetical protein
MRLRQARTAAEWPSWGHTTLTILMSRYYRYVPNLVRQDGAILAKRLEER